MIKRAFELTPLHPEAPMNMAKSIATILLPAAAFLFAGCSGPTHQTANTPCGPSSQQEPSDSVGSDGDKSTGDNSKTDGSAPGKNSSNKGSAQTSDQCIAFTVPRIDKLSPKSRVGRMKISACNIGAVQGEPDFKTVCPSGYWVPKSQEPAKYQACKTDADCIRADIPGCCSMTYVALSRSHPCITDMGSSCEMECGDQVASTPKNGDQMRAKCVDGTCELKTP